MIYLTEKKVALLDIDGTLCESFFANVKHNDNGKFDAEFLDRLSKVEPYPWVKEWDWEQYSKTPGNMQTMIFCTGRLRWWNWLTAEWLINCFGGYVIQDEIINIHWDDSLPTREESYKKYVQQKTLKLLELVARYNYEGYHVDVFEDDRKVLTHLGAHDYRHVDFTRYIVEDGIINEMNLQYFLRDMRNV
jgi:hypothetical protein